MIEYHTTFCEARDGIDEDDASLVSGLFVRCASFIVKPCNQQKERNLHINITFCTKSSWEASQKLERPRRAKKLGDTQCSKTSQQGLFQGISPRPHYAMIEELDHTLVELFWDHALQAIKKFM